MEFSEDYYDMLERHRKAHAEGVDRLVGGEIKHTEGRKVFEGSELLPMLPVIKEIMQDMRLSTLFDFGCGKAAAYHLSFEIEDKVYSNVYEYLNINPVGVHLYDPCVEEFKSKPRREQFYDVLVCTDVMEHITEDAIDAILEEMVYHANHAMVFKISSHPSFAQFKDGVNAHATIKPPKWWFDKIINIATASGRKLALHMEVEERPEGEDSIRKHITRQMVNEDV